MTDNDPGRRPIPARSFAPTKRAVAWLAAQGVMPDQVSLFGLAAGVSSGAALALTAVWPAAAPGLWIAAALCVLLRGLSNMTDEMLAVEHGKGRATGIFWNEVPDRVSDVALLVGAGYSLGGSPAAGWLGACLALLVTYIRAVGTLAGAPADFGGPFAKQQRMFSVAGLCVLLALTPSAWHPAWGPGAAWGPMAAWLWLLSAGIAWTCLRRLRRAVAWVKHSSHT
jgi:phosphatidylglycerophosphate synthase